MQLSQLLSSIQYPMDLFAVFACAICGAFLAVRKDFDLIATVLLAEVATLGGGLFRDLVIGVKPISFTDPAYYLTPVGAAVIVYFSTTLQQHEKAVDVFDAIALGLLSVTGTTKGLVHGFDPAPAAALGLATAIGGGIMAHLVAREVPPVLRWDQDLYSLPALLGAGATSLLHMAKWLTVPSAAGAAVLAIGVRLLALHHGWRTPRSLTWRRRTAQQPTATPPVPAPTPAFPSFEDTMRIRFAERLDDTIRIRRPVFPAAEPAAQPFTDPRVPYAHAPRPHATSHRQVP
ncbi:trimeric intracellular cation channel family protein [Streptomyces sp. NPDC059850]|uniref:trimeric intracellular cation channel family protein n=1 Tax=Streptomyces sp. NPDC059850 TaxID=3346970 RepID=UPI00364A0CCD